MDEEENNKKKLVSKCPVENLKLFFHFLPDQSNPRFRIFLFYFVWFWQQTFEPQLKVTENKCYTFDIPCSVLICVFITKMKFYYFFCVSYNLNCFIFCCCCSYYFFRLFARLFCLKIANANELPTNTQKNNNNK